MTAPTPVNGLEQFLQEIEKYVAMAQTTLAFVEKFENFLPAGWRAPLETLVNDLNTVNTFLHKL